MRQHITTAKSMASTIIVKASKFLKSTIKGLEANGIIGMINPNHIANLFFNINNTPSVKYTIPKTRAGTKLGSEGPLIAKYRCKIPENNNRPVAR